MSKFAIIDRLFLLFMPPEGKDRDFKAKADEYEKGDEEEDEEIDASTEDQADDHEDRLTFVSKWEKEDDADGGKMKTVLKEWAKSQNGDTVDQQAIYDRLAEGDMSFGELLEGAAELYAIKNSDKINTNNMLDSATMALQQIIQDSPFSAQEKTKLGLRIRQMNASFNKDYEKLAILQREEDLNHELEEAYKNREKAVNEARNLHEQALKEVDSAFEEIDVSKKDLSEAKASLGRKLQEKGYVSSRDFHFTPEEYHMNNGNKFEGEGKLVVTRNPQFFLKLSEDERQAIANEIQQVEAKYNEALQKYRSAYDKANAAIQKEREADNKLKQVESEEDKKVKAIEDKLKELKSS